MKQKKPFFDRLGHFFYRAFINGLLVILPFTLTIGLFILSARLIINWLKPVQKFIEHPIHFIATIPYKTIGNQLFLLLLGILLFGIVVRTIVLRNLIQQFEKLLCKIPLIRPVYSGIKQLVHAFSVQDKITFKKVVLVEFPRKGIHSLGFLTSQLPQPLSPRPEENYFNIFIPTTPNPTSGYFVILSKADFQEVDLTRHEAMAMIISGGIIQPDRFEKPPEITQ